MPRSVTFTGQLAFATHWQPITILCHLDFLPDQLEQTMPKALIATCLLTAISAPAWANDTQFQSVEQVKADAPITTDLKYNLELPITKSLKWHYLNKPTQFEATQTKPIGPQPIEINFDFPSPEERKPTGWEGFVIAGLIN